MCFASSSLAVAPTWASATLTPVRPTICAATSATSPAKPRSAIRNRLARARRASERSHPASTRTAVGTRTEVGLPRRRRWVMPSRWASTSRCLRWRASTRAWMASLSRIIALTSAPPPVPLPRAGHRRRRLRSWWSVDHPVSSNARRAAAMARRMSPAEASATSPMTSSVARSVLSNRRPPSGLQRRLPVVSPKNNTLFSELVARVATHGPSGDQTGQRERSSASNSATISCWTLAGSMLS